MIRTILFSALILITANTSFADKPTIIVYTYESFASEWGPGPAIKKGFEEECDCLVEYVAVADSVAMLAKLELEGRSTKADVLLGLDNYTVERARNTGLFMPHNLPSMKNSMIPVEWNDNIFTPFDWGVMAFIYNTETMDNPPKSFEDLQNLPENTQIVLQDPRTSTPGYALLQWVATLFPETSDQVWKNMRPNISTFTKGWWDSYSMYLEGGADLVLSYTTSPAYHMIVENESKHQATEFTDGHILQIELAAIVKYSQKSKLARDFLKYLQSKKAQSVIPTTNWMFPIRNDVELPEAFGKLIKPKVFIGDENLNESNRVQRIRNWQMAVR